MPCPVLRALLPTSSSSSQSARMALSNPATQTHPMNLPWVNHGYYCCLPQRQLLWLHGAEGKSHRMPIVCHLPAPYFHRNLIGTSSEPHRNLIGTSPKGKHRITKGCIKNIYGMPIAYSLSPKTNQHNSKKTPEREVHNNLNRTSRVRFKRRSGGEPNSYR